MKKSRYTESQIEGAALVEVGMIRYAERRDLERRSIFGSIVKGR